MENYEILAVILVMFAVTFFTRALPFYMAHYLKNNGLVNYLGKIMPACVVFSLVIYSFKDLDFLRFPYGAPEILAALVVVVLHLAFKNVLLSLVGGVAVFYALLNVLI
jgi:branched-subunit amino acid transport protein AzlD